MESARWMVSSMTARRVWIEVEVDVVRYAKARRCKD